jgi:type VI secretion system secreted protein Hcp
MKSRLANMLAICTLLTTAPAIASAQTTRTLTPQVQPAPGGVAPLLSTGPIKFYVTIQGRAQGAFKGQSASANHQGQIEGLQFSLDVTSPHDPTSGLATGRRQYSAVTLTKRWDASSPQLLQAEIANEVLSSVQFDFVRNSPDGREYTFETIRLTDATVSAFRHFVTDAPSSAGTSQAEQPLEEVSFMFRTMTIVNNDARTTASDALSAQ